jgi:hypothetical protein
VSEDLPEEPRVFASCCTALKLKTEAIRSDSESMMFLARSAPARPANELRSLRRSLNTPVLSIAQLPVGPASAVIAAHVDSGDGLWRYTLAVRSERSREGVLFAAREDDLARSDSSLAAEAALSLAEGMGFLFEEDSRSIFAGAAASIWEEFVDSGGSSAAQADVRPVPLLTKFRRSPSWIAAEPASVSTSEVTPHSFSRGAAVGVEVPDTRIARQGDR